MKKLTFLALSIILFNFCLPEENIMPRSSIQSITGTIQTENANIWYKKFFTANSIDKTPLICLHGGPGFSHHCMLDLQALAIDRPVIFYDQSGCGNSKNTDNTNWTFDHYLTELEEIINALGYEKVILLGSSWGGTLAAKYASLNQNKLEALILASPLISTAQWISDCQKLALSISPEFLQLILKHEAAGSTQDPEYQDAVTVFYNNFLCRLQPWPQNVLDSCAVVNSEIYHTMWGPSEFTATGNLKDVDLTDKLSNITIPTLITCGRFDTATPETMQKYCNFLPNGKIVVLETSAHMNIAEEPEIYVKIIKSFLHDKL